MYKYGIPAKELAKIRKLIMQDIRSNNKINNPIENMTLQDYFDIVKECMLGCTNENGVVVDQWGEPWYSDFKKQDMREAPSIEVAKAWMDGRGLFTEHFNSNLLKTEKHFGNWPNLDQHEENQWYHEDRLNDPLWFKECVAVIGHGGHPTEMLSCGNFNPVEYEENKWYMSFGTFSRSDFYTLKGYKYLKEKGLPVFIYAAQTYLTPKQIKELKSEGYLLTKDYVTGYME